MKFGIFYELQMPRPWEVAAEQKLFKNALDQLEIGINEDTRNHN